MTNAQQSVLERLAAVIAERKAASQGSRSYVASLMGKGPEAINAKILEEAGELAEAGRAEPGGADIPHLVHEAADLIFHSMVLLGFHDVGWAPVEAELARRFGLSGLEEKASRQNAG